MGALLPRPLPTPTCATSHWSLAGARPAAFVKGEAEEVDLEQMTKMKVEREVKNAERTP
jgi:hypothetical protein